jgi:hypothetical protein
MTPSQYSSLSRSITLTLLSAAVLTACGGGTSDSDATTADGLSASDTSSAAAGTDSMSSIERYRATTAPTTAPAPALAPSPSPGLTTAAATTATATTASATWAECAQENETCSLSGTHNVKYGTLSAYVIKSFTGSAACNNATFGDPAVHQWKKCWVDTSSGSTAPAPAAAPSPAPAPTTGSTTWTQCAQENETCSLSGTHNVKYGVASAYVIKSFTGSAACNNATFGDPAVGQWKKCWVDSSSAAITPAPAPPTAPRVVTPAPVTPPATAPATPPSGAAWTGVSSAMWAEINNQRAAFGDRNDCKARVDAVPTTGTTINPGADINAALAGSSVVILSGGTYNLSGPVNIPAGKKLVGAAGQTVTLNARGADRGVQLGTGATLANVIVDGATTFGVLPFSSAGYSNNTLIYQVSVRHTGFYSSTSGSDGIYIAGGAANNCVVSSDVSNSWNEAGSVNGHGGNADGVVLKFGAHDNTLIDVVSFKNGDDGIDMWQGGQMYCYFCNAHDNAKVDGKGSSQGDGNGIKLGVGSVAHKFYKTTANNNSSGGFNLNGNSVQPILVQTTAGGNVDGNYMNGVIAP